MTGKSWPATNIEMWPVDDLVPYAKNARLHPGKQIEQIAASIQRFGFTMPILAAEDGTIIAGHGRCLAAQQLGIPDVPVIVARGWSDEDRRLYTLADNRLAETSEWDTDLLQAELADLRLSFDEMDFSSIGFSADELAELIPAKDEPDDPDDDADARPSLAERFGIAPFSVLNAREGWWQDRKRAWLALGIRSEVGRGENLLAFSDTINEPDPKKRAAKKAAASAKKSGA